MMLFKTPDVSTRANKKSIRLSQRVQKCDCCTMEVTTFFVSYNDPAKPGNYGKADPVGRPWPTRTGQACSPEHAMKLMQTFIDEEMANGPA